MPNTLFLKCMSAYSILALFAQCAHVPSAIGWRARSRPRSPPEQIDESWSSPVIVPIRLDNINSNNPASLFLAFLVLPSSRRFRSCILIANKTKILHRLSLHEVLVHSAFQVLFG